MYWAAVAPLWLGDDDLLASLLDRDRDVPRARVGRVAGGAAVAAGGAPGLAERFDAAAEAANEGYELAMEIGMINRAMMPLAVLAYVNAIHGDHDKA